MANVNNDLTPNNFIEKIKLMAERDRNKITAKKLIELICQVPDPPIGGNQSTISNQMEELQNSFAHISQMVATNKTELATMRIENAEYAKKNVALKLEIDLLKVHAQDCRQHREDRPPPQPPQPQNNHHAEIKHLREAIVTIQEELNSIQQYLRVNNIEIVGLPTPNDGESEEMLLINAINELEGLEEPVRPEDIDISHPLPSNRKDGKPVHVVRFVHRKTKFAILAAKKREQNKQFKFRNKDVYLNEHLSKMNRGLFAAAQEKKRALDYKFCWTRGGTIYLRKTETSEPATIQT